MGPLIKSLASSPTLSYCGLMLLGAFGVWLSMPIVLQPQSSVERLDLAINIIIFVPSIFVAVVGGVLAILSAVFAYQPDGDHRIVRIAYAVTRLFGFSEQLVRQLAQLSPVALWRGVFGSGGSDGSPPNEAP